MEIPKMTAVYHCNEEWVKRAILHYHRNISKFEYSEKDFDIEVTAINGTSIITVNRKESGSIKRKGVWIDFLYFLSTQFRAWEFKRW